MDGVIVIDKPEGLTSHDVVVAARRLFGEKRIGHTGTLDPLATGVLPLACGRATRLVRFLSAAEKEYEATVLFGVTTDTLDVTGEEISRSGHAPSRETLVTALRSFEGEQLQVPPAYSAKKVAGRRAYELARRDESVVLDPVRVRVSRIELLEDGNDRCRVRLTCSAGFYVRALVRDLGERCNTGATLEALRRTRSGDFTLDEAIDLDALGPVRDRTNPESRVPNPGMETALIPMERLLPGFPAVTVTAEGLTRVSHGQHVRPVDLTGDAPVGATGWVRLLDSGGALVGLGTPQRLSGFLHPEVVLI
ncbi:MAG TPA: tRNA pseudouridine(55) synthase TruB [Vicinamibacterales bacterium]|nr:tRNA pseudouridine(55) synthase TruB [Vicinamibacterales bacterium]